MSKLQIPDFNQFLIDMGNERYEYWADAANKAVESFFPLQAPVFQSGADQFATALTALNQRLTIEMLRDYHEWLIEQLSKKSLHLL